MDGRYGDAESTRKTLAAVDGSGDDRDGAGFERREKALGANFLWASSDALVS